MHCKICNLQSSLQLAGLLISLWLHSKCTQVLMLYNNCIIVLASVDEVGDAVIAEAFAHDLAEKQDCFSVLIIYKTLLRVIPAASTCE